MRSFELVTIIVSLVSIGLAATSYFSVSRVLARLGRQGQAWFDHIDDVDPPERPSEDDRDDPIPRRRLRGRAEP